MTENTPPHPHFLVASDFDQTLSFNDSGHVLAEMLGVTGFQEKVDGLARSNLVQPPHRTVYVGDGNSDVHVMLHVNSGDGFTIAVSENRQLARIAKSTVLSDSAFSILVPVLDQIFGWRAAEIRQVFEDHGLSLDGWERARTDRVTSTPRLQADALT
jgi:predicted HAD superfamily phosphohydrolase